MISFQCIIYEEALCVKVHLKALLEEMLADTKDVNLISALALHKRQFQVLLMWVKYVYEELKMYNNIRLLSQGLFCFYHELSDKN